jgi:hypothetical protein
MRSENIVSEPLKSSYKLGVYSTMVMCGIFLVAFVLWSIASFGGAILKLIGVEY